MPTPAEMLSKANTAYDAGEFLQAIKLYRGILRTHPKDAALLHKVGTCYGRLAESKEAGDYIKKAIAVEPTVPRWCDLATALQLQGRMREAWAACDAASALAPHDADETRALCTRVNLLNIEGRSDESFELLAPYLDAGDLTPRMAGLIATTCKNRRSPEIALPAVERCLARSAPASGDRAELLFHRANLLHQMKQFADAFASYEEANTIKARRDPFDPEKHDETVDRIIATWTAEAHRAPRSQNRNDRPVFVLGMPRSGTSLVEQILDCHPEVHGGGELAAMIKAAERFGRKATQRGDPANLLAGLNARDVNDAARVYLRDLPREAGKARRVTDKMTLNFLFVGLIAVLLPRARIIHCVRDPLDTCLSCYCQDFLGSLPFTRDLYHLGRYYRNYERLMTHWKTVVELPVLDVVYEELVERPEEVIRGMIAHLGLDWNDACLRSHESDRVTVTASVDQVRQPMYRTSVGRHRDYDAFLGPLRQGLDDGAGGTER